MNTDFALQILDYLGMSIATAFTRAELGIEAPLVTIEVHLSNGLPRTHIVGLAETAVRESKERVRSALMNSQFDYPRKVITINLGPADLPKQGCRYDLPVALGMLAAMGVFPAERLQKFEFMGELGLNGDIKPVPGILPSASQTVKSVRSLIIPDGNSVEASLLNSSKIYVVDHLLALVRFLQHKQPLSLARDVPREKINCLSPAKLSDIKGQHLAKRALIIAASGSHNLIMIGPPGTGKTMLASRLAGLLPPLTQDESLELASIQSVSNRVTNLCEWGLAPFRTPHHTATAVSLCGGGSHPRPGEISLAHRGILFLDELPEYSRRVLEVLREPLESGKISISRARYKITYPARFQLVATMNPCPCGFAGRDNSRCTCTQDKIHKYRSRLSGPLLDRIDLHVEVPPLPKGSLSDPHLNSCENEHQEAVSIANKVRQNGLTLRGKANAYLTVKETERVCKITPDSRKMLDNAIDKLGLSARGYYKILKIALTIAEMEGDSSIRLEHLAEAISYRKLDRFQNASME